MRSEAQAQPLTTTSSTENGFYQVRQCTDEACHLRFPVRMDELPAHCCPRCGAPTIIAVEIDQSADRPPLPFSSDPIAPEPTAAHVAPPIVVIVDNVRSLFNVGSIFRSADGAGIAHLYLCGITPTPANPKLHKTALGAEAVVPWSHDTNSLTCVQRLRSAGYLLWALEEAASATSIFTTPMPASPLALVIGNEVIGVDPSLLALCDAVVSIPMKGTKRSLNVATAFGAAAIVLTHRAATEQVLPGCPTDP